LTDKINPLIATIYFGIFLILSTRTRPDFWVLVHEGWVRVAYSTPSLVTIIAGALV